MSQAISTPRSTRRSRSSPRRWLHRDLLHGGVFACGTSEIAHTGGQAQRQRYPSPLIASLGCASLLPPSRFGGDQKKKHEHAHRRLHVSAARVRGLTRTCMGLHADFTAGPFTYKRFEKRVPRLPAGVQRVFCIAFCHGQRSALFFRRSSEANDAACSSNRCRSG